VFERATRNLSHLLRKKRGPEQDDSLSAIPNQQRERGLDLRDRPASASTTCTPICVELGVPIQLQVGVSMIYAADYPRQSVGRPITLDAVACDFFELTSASRGRTR